MHQLLEFTSTEIAKIRECLKTIESLHDQIKEFNPNQNARVIDGHLIKLSNNAKIMADIIHRVLDVNDIPIISVMLIHSVTLFNITEGFATRSFAEKERQKISDILQRLDKSITELRGSCCYFGPDYSSWELDIAKIVIDAKIIDRKLIHDQYQSEDFEDAQDYANTQSAINHANLQNKLVAMGNGINTDITEKFSSSITDAIDNYFDSIFGLTKFQELTKEQHADLLDRTLIMSRANRIFYNM